MMMAEQVVESGEGIMALQKYSLKELNVSMHSALYNLEEINKLHGCRNTVSTLYISP